ncbi:MAG: aldehyde ferredoxin oxidoreductase, partial [Deltaproteobacteria bacterium]|nr:aldehyde ferredoxin oxidoreductase [Deltaproteobacteria bacterium]
LVIKGKAESPCYLKIEDGEITINDTDYLWGLSTSDTESRLQEELSSKKGERMSIAAIGQAGENLVRFSSIINEKRAHGRGGAGAVMGSKNLKAVVVRGSQKLQIADEESFKEIVRRCRRKIAENPMTGKGGTFPKVGTMMTVDLTQATGTFPTRNWQENTFEYSSEIDGEAFLKYQVRPRACFACPIGCSRDTKTIRGNTEYVTEGPDYETIYSFGSNCEINDPGVVIAADRLCDDYGMDTISCGVTIGFAMECFEKGLISREETKGMDLRFGNGDALLEVIHLIAEKEGIGKLLSEGSKRVSEKIEGGRNFAMHVKGMELRTELLGLPEPIDRYAYENKAEMVRELQLGYATFDCIIACIFGAFAITFEDYTDAISAETGWSLTQEELRTIAERAWNTTRLFNVREGFTREHDTLPERLFAEASTFGPSDGEVVDRASFEKMLDEYYEYVGWDKDTGIPTESKLAELGIEAGKGF